MKNKTEFLYGKHTPPEIPKDIIARRIECLNKHIDDLIKVDYKKRTTEQDYRLNEVVKARSFWEKFLKGDEI